MVKKFSLHVSPRYLIVHLKAILDHRQSFIEHRAQPEMSVVCLYIQYNNAFSWQKSTEVNAATAHTIFTSSHADSQMLLKKTLRAFPKAKMNSIQEVWKVLFKTSTTDYCGIYFIDSAFFKIALFLLLHRTQDQKHFLTFKHTFMCVQVKRSKSLEFGYTKFYPQHRWYFHISRQSMADACTAGRDTEAQPEMNYVAAALKPSVA